MKKVISMALFVILVLTLMSSAVAAPALSNVVDEAGLLTAAEAEYLNGWAYEISEKYQCAVIVFTADEYAPGDGFDMAMAAYDTWGFGYGADNRGVMLYLNMHGRDWGLYVEGSAQDAITKSYGQESMEERFLPYLRDGDFYEAFYQYVYDCALFMELAVRGTPVTSRNDPYTEGSRKGFQTVVSVAVPLLIAAIFCLVNVMKMKTAKQQRAANQYMTQNGFDLTGQRDEFLYATETRTEIETKSSSSGGSSSRSSSHSSGRSGKF